jgi:hypothetical protein
MIYEVQRRIRLLPITDRSRQTFRPQWGASHSLFTWQYEGLWLSKDQPMTIVLVAFTIMFGTCHLFGWNYPFPTISEIWLWRSASIACMVFPLLVILMQGRQRHRHNRVVHALLMGLITVYVFVRLFLLFEIFFALRSAPPQIYGAVPWAQYIPHI